MKQMRHQQRAQETIMIQSFIYDQYHFLSLFMISIIFYLFFIGWRSGWLSVCKYEEKQLPCVKLAINKPFRCKSMNVQVCLNWVL